VPGGMGCLHEKGQLFISFVSPTGGTERQETGDHRRSPQSVGYSAAWLWFCNNSAA
jgi:hypothetical protein